MALYTLGISEWKKAELRSSTSSGASNQSSYEIPLFLNVQVSSHTIFHPPLVLECLWISWTIPSYSPNTSAHNHGLPFHDIRCHYSGWHPGHEISKFHNFLNFSSSVTFFSTLFQPPSVMGKPGLWHYCSTSENLCSTISFSDHNFWHFPSSSLI